MTCKFEKQRKSTNRNREGDLIQYERSVCGVGAMASSNAGWGDDDGGDGELAMPILKAKFAFFFYNLILILNN